VRDALDHLEIEYHLDGRIVRGLDYYQRTAFELESPRLGAQRSILGGGRYDGLVQELGGPDLPGVGWAAGVERFLLALETMPAATAPLDVFVAALPETRSDAFALAERMRRHGIRTELDLLGRSLKSQLKDAARLGATYAVVVGPEEWARGCVSLRHLGSSAQEELEVEVVLSRLGPS
jgi:histidyl-tRNA synthetase